MPQTADRFIAFSTASTMRPSHRALHARAFTLIEVLIVLVIVLAIGGVVAVNLLPRREQAIEDTVRVQMDQIEQALEQFYFDFSRYPSEEEGLNVLWDSTALENEDDAAKYRGPYLKSPIREDQYGNAFGYRFPGETDENMYDLWSNGKDGEEGTDDDILAREGDDEGDGAGGGSDFGGFDGGGAGGTGGGGGGG